VVRTTMTPEQMRISTLRHNRARGSEDLELTAQVLRDLEALGALDWAQDSLMMDDIEIQRLLEDIPAPEALAEEEYGEAWEPDKIGQEGTGIAPVEGSDYTADGKTWTTASTSQALERSREREQQLRDAHSDEQRQMIAKDTAKDFYRLSLLFYGDEAEVVKAALHEAPAEVLTALCRKEMQQVRSDMGEGWVTIDEVLGKRTMPAAVAERLKACVDRLQAEGVVTDKNRWQAVEFIVAEFEAGYQPQAT